MKPDQAAKVLREHNAWRRRGSMDRMPHSAQTIGHAIDAAVAALEVAAVPVAYRYRIGGPTVEWRYAPGDATLTRNAIVESEPLYAAPQPAYCCAKCGLAEMHPRERALLQDAKRGNFRQEDDGA